MRLLLVATVCQALLGLAAVATNASWQTDTPLATGTPGPRTAVALDHSEREPAPDDVSAVEVPTSSPSSPSTATTARSSSPRGDGPTPTTTTLSSGPTSTTAKGTAPTTATTGPEGPKCPNPKTCDVYRIIDQRDGGPHGGTKGWRPAADGIIRVPFYVNATPPAGSSLTADTMEAAHLAGTKIIEAQNPRIRFEYKGRTERIPRESDGFNDFMFGGKAIVLFDAQGYIREADIRPSTGTPAGDWAYTPCDQRDGACGKSGSGKREIMTMLLHEEFHTVGAADLYGAETSQLTMDAGADSGDDRESVTPGLGDVRVLRVLYPTSAPMPPIYAP